METVRISLIGKKDLAIGTGSFEIVLADGKTVQVDEIDIGALLELTPVKTYATTALLPDPSLAGQLARVTADGFLYMSNGTTWSSALGGHTHPYTDFTSGTVAVANGGTGSDFSATGQGSLWYFSNTGVVSASAVGSLGALLEAKPTGGANPVWIGPLTNGQVFIGSIGSDPVAATLTGSNGITVTNSAGGITLSGGRKTVRKTANEEVSLSTTLQDDGHLVLAVGASEVWHFNFLIFLDAPGAADIKCCFTVPVGATGRWGMFAIATTAASSTASAAMQGGSVDLDGSATLSAGGVDGEFNTVLIRGTIVNSTNAGNLQLQWAQDSSAAEATIVLINSFAEMVQGA